VHQVADQSLICRSRLRAAGVRFALATPADDEQIRRLLRENPMPGKISVSLEREPDLRLAAAIEGDEHHIIIAREEGGGRIIAVGSVSIRMRLLNGKPQRVGYLSQLRLDYRCRPRASVILGGYAFLRQFHESLGVKLYLTSIAADNAPARRLLERGLAGMPTYRPLCEFVTLLFRRRRNGDFSKVTAGVRGDLRDLGLTLRHGGPELMPEAADLLSRAGLRGQVVPTWSGAELESLMVHGLYPNHFRLLFEGGRAVACAAVWDQRSTRQAVVRGYSAGLRRLRVPLNLLAPVTQSPRLPRVGEALSFALISHVCTPADRPELIEPLVRSLHGSAHTLGVDSIGVGFDARDPRLAVLRRAFGGVEYRTRLYVVHWEDGRDAAEALDDRLCEPEVALL
jgi:hypothetical protein